MPTTHTPVTLPNSAASAWLSTPLGLYLQAEEQALYDEAVADLFGFNALQMGGSPMDLLRQSRIAHRFCASHESLLAQPQHLCCEDDFLPFADMSLDLLLLPHRLEFSERPHQTLREAERVMMPEGHLLISGFNPLSLWGLTHMFKNVGKHGDGQVLYPWHGHFIGLNRLKDWLALLGFEVLSVNMACHAVPFEQSTWQSRLRLISRITQKWLPRAGGVYFIVAKKRVAGMTLLKPNWKKAPIQRALIARPTQRKPSQKEGVEQ